MTLAPGARAKFDANVEAQIAAHGFHVTLVQASVVPRWLYTIGLTRRGLPELVLPGATDLFAADAHAIVSHVARALHGGACSTGTFTVSGHGTFTLRETRRRWTSQLMLGTARWFGADGYTALQIVADAGHATRDTPDLAAGTPDDDPVWRWLDRDPPPNVSKKAKVATDLEILRGAPATHVARWEEDYWEMFGAAPPTEERMRVVPFLTMLGLDPTLEAASSLAVGRAIRRKSRGAWTPWGRSGGAV